jgi:hypothetical protein
MDLTVMRRPDGDELDMVVDFLVKFRLFRGRLKINDLSAVAEGSDFVIFDSSFS